MPLNINLHQTFLHLLNFVLLFGILYFLLYNPIIKFMYKRTEEYNKMEEKVKQKLNEAEKLKADYTERIASAEIEIAKNKSQAEKNAGILADECLKKAEREAQSILETAHNAAENEKKKIIEGAQNEIADMVTTATQKVISNSSDVYDDFFNTVKKDGNFKK